MLIYMTIYTLSLVALVSYYWILYIKYIKLYDRPIPPPQAEEEEENEQEKEETNAPVTDETDEEEQPNIREYDQFKVIPDPDPEGWDDVEIFHRKPKNNRKKH